MNPVWRFKHRKKKKSEICHRCVWIDSVLQDKEGEVTKLAAACREGGGWEGEQVGLAVVASQPLLAPDLSQSPPPALIPVWSQATTLIFSLFDIFPSLFYSSNITNTNTMLSLLSLKENHFSLGESKFIENSFGYEMRYPNTSSKETMNKSFRW